MTPLELLLSKLPGARKSGNGWSARCPAHDDRHASLSVSTGDDGRVLLHCHAGCDTAAIVAALGLGLADLFPPKPDALRAKRGGRAYPSVNDALSALERQHGPRSASWTYHDAAGQPVGLVVRWDKPGGGKEVRPVARRADGWHVAAMPEPRPLYRLPHLLRAGPTEPVFVLEGEKAADAAVKLGLVATTSVGGSQAANKTDWRPLARPRLRPRPARRHAPDLRRGRPGRHDSTEARRGRRELSAGSHAEGCQDLRGRRQRAIGGVRPLQRRSDPRRPRQAARVQAGRHRPDRQLPGRSSRCPSG